MFRQVEKLLACVFFVILLAQLQARAADLGFGSSSNAPGSCKQQDCHAAFFVAESQQPEVLIFNQAAKVIGSIAVPPPVSALATDSQARIYISNDAMSTVAIYSPPLYNIPTKISVPPGKRPGGVAVDTRSGRFVVFSDVRYYGVEAQMYEPNSTTPCATIQAPAAGVFFGTGAFDRDGTLYAPINATAGGIALVSIPGGCKAHTAQLLTFSQRYNVSPYKIEFNSNNDLAIENEFGGPDTEAYTLYTFHHPKNGQFGKPIAVTRFATTSAGFAYRTFVSFLGDGKHLWATGALNLSLYNYPQGGAPVLSLEGDAVSLCRMAVVPPLQP